MNRWQLLLHSKDKNIFMYFNQKLRCRILDLILPRITHLGGAFFTIAMCSGLFFFGEGSVKLAAQDAIITLGGSQSIVQLGKNLIRRQRPYLVLPEVNTLWTKLLRDCSFPSGHTTTGFSMAVVFAQRFPNLGYIVYSLAALVGVSRMYVGMHYPSDVISGAFIGVITGMLTLAVRAM